MKKHLKVIILTVLSVIAVEFIGHSVWSMLKHYDNVCQQNNKLKKELRECREKLESYENPSRTQDYIQYRAIEVR